MRLRTIGPTQATAILLAATALTMTLAIAGAPRPACAADNFYENLLRQGSLAYASGDLVGAEKQLRLACFGLLDEPTPLADCLVRLATAQGQLDQNDDFQATFGRLLEVEERFAGYSAAQLPQAIQEPFVELVKSRVARETLQGYDAFKPVARQMLEAELLALDASGRREAFERQIALEPGDSRWHLALAELELESGNAGAALAAVEGLGPSMQDPRGTCLRGRALSALGRCSEALGPLATCGDPTLDLGLAEQRLGCLVAVGQYTAAEQLYTRLPADWQRRRALRRLVKDARRGYSASQQALSGDEGEGEASPLAAGDQAAGDQAAGDQAAEPTVPAPSPGAASPDPAKDQTPPAGTGAPTPTSAKTGRIATEPPAAEPPPARTAPPTDPRVEATLAELRQLLQQGSAVTDSIQLKQLTDRAIELASRLPLSAEAQQIAGELAYRDSRFSAATRYFERARPTRPDLQFYFAVALYETNQPQRAATELRRALPKLQRSAYVDEMTARILGSDP